MSPDPVKDAAPPSDDVAGDFGPVPTRAPSSPVDDRAGPVPTGPATDAGIGCCALLLGGGGVALVRWVIVPAHGDGIEHTIRFMVLCVALVIVAVAVVAELIFLWMVKRHVARLTVLVGLALALVALALLNRGWEGGY